MAGMTGIGGNNNGIDSYSSSLRGISGLNSGLDRDGMIKSMTLRTRTKISRYKQKIQRATWKQEAYREISDKLIELSRNYLSVLSDKSLIRASTFKNYDVEAIGEFKGKVTASGSPSDLEGINIMGISNKASDTHYTSKSLSGSSELTTGALDMKKEIAYGSLEGKTLEISIGLGDKVQNYDVKFKSGDYDIYQRESDGKIKKDADGNALLDDEKVKKVKELFKESFANTEVTLNRKKYNMSDFLKVDFVKNGSKDYDLKIKINDEKTVPSGVSGAEVPLGSLNSIRVMGGSALQVRGMTQVNPILNPKGIDLNASEQTGGWSMTINTAEAMIGGYKGENDYEKKTAGELLLGKTINFTVNGLTKSITFPEIYTSGANGEIKVKKEGISYDLSKEEDVAKYLDTELKKAFGRDKISAEYDSSNKIIKFKPADNVSFSMSSDDGHIFGGDKSIFNTASGISNRVSLSTDLRKPSSSPAVKKLDEYAKHIKNVKTGTGYTSFAELLENENVINMNINGNKVQIKTKNINTISDLVREINNDNNLFERGKTNGEYNSIFHVNYDERSDTFTFTSTDKGANSVVSDGGLWANTIKDQMTNADVTSLEATLFGEHNKDDIKKGENATIFYKDKNSDTIHQLVSSTNNFEIGKAKFSIEGAFNVKTVGSGFALIDENTTGVKFKSTINADKIVESVKSMVKDFNELTELMGKQFKTNSERDKKTGKLKYDALTDEQKEKMSEKQIEKWEKKAKDGILFGDPTLREARDGLLGMIYSGNKLASGLESIGIKQVSYFNNKNGGLEFDEKALRQALKDRPEEVEKIFIGDSLGNKGFAQHMKETISRYASDTGSYKGSLVERAGSKYVPATIFSNQSFSEIDELNKSLKIYEGKLKGEEDRYIKRFARLEKIMMKANMQSGYIGNLQK